MHVEKYYTVETYLHKRMANMGRQLGYKADNLEGYFQWKNEVRSKLKETIGLNTMLSCDLNPVVQEHTDCGDYIREKIVITTEPDIFMPFYILVPKGIKKGEKRPAVIACHGHCSSGKLSTAGIREVDGVGEMIESARYDYGVQFAKEGFISLCPDARGFGERREKYMQGDSQDKYMGDSCTVINRWAMVLGQSVVGMWTWDLMRLIDYIGTRDDCNPDSIGCAGLSGGGLQTLWLAALDDRVKAAVISGYFYGFMEALLDIGQCSCNYAPHVWEYVDVGDIGALIAPRPLVIETGDKDGLNGKSNLNNVIPQVETVRKAYRLFRKEDSLIHDIFDGPHRWNGIASVAYFKKVLTGIQPESFLTQQP